MNGHTLSVMNTNDAYATNDARNMFFMNVYTDADVTIKNGKIAASKTCLFRIFSGGIRVADA